MKDIIEIMSEIEHLQWERFTQKILKDEDISYTTRKRWESYQCNYKDLPEHIKEIDRQCAYEQIQALRKAGYKIVKGK